MKFLVRRSDTGYLDTDLWVPKSAVNVQGVRNALTFQTFDQKSVRLLTLYRETEHHILVPREFWKPADFQFPVIDCRPRRYPRVDIRSRIQLDHKFVGDKLVPTGLHVQKEAMEALLHAQGGVLQLSCGAGKTVVALDYIARMEMPALIVVDTTQLVIQWQEEIASFLDIPDGVGRIQAGVFDWKHPVVIATYHTLAERAATLPEEVRRWFGVVVWDECFPAGTPVDGLPIEKHRAGGCVRSFNHATGEVEERRILRTFVSKPRQLLRVHLAGGASYVVTSGHPFYTQRGYIEAGLLQPHDAVARVGHHVYAPSSVHLVQRTSHADKTKERPAEEVRTGVLLQRTRQPGSRESLVRYSSAHKQEVRLRTHEEKESDALRDYTEEGLGDSACNRTSPQRTWGQRPATHTCATNVDRAIEVASGVRSENRSWQQSQGTIYALQDRPGMARTEDRHRDRRRLPHSLATPSTRQEEGSLFTWVGVDSIEILEPGRDGTYGGLCPDGLVYNLEVEGNNNYFIDDLLVHNCHHVAAPTFARSANLFYCRRFGLSATPVREDGLNVVYEHHIGPVLYKNLDQELKPSFYFVWTGLGLDPNDANVQAAARDLNGELHIGKIASVLGAWPKRIQFAIDQIQQAVAQNRKVLVLSKSVDALVNLLAAWNQQASLFTDIPFPTAQDVGELVPPHALSKEEHAKVQKQLFALNGAIQSLRQGPQNPRTIAKLQNELARQATLDLLLEAHRVFKKCEVLWNKQRTHYIADLLKQPSTAGLMIHRIKPALRTKMLREKQVTFAIMKYGREGLNEKSLDTCIVNEPISSHNTLQQLMGRLLRFKQGKQAPIVVFLEDDIGPFIGMCKKLRRHLMSWPADEGGPFTYTNIRPLPVLGHNP